LLDQFCKRALIRIAVFLDMTPCDSRLFLPILKLEAEISPETLVDVDQFTCHIPLTPDASLTNMVMTLSVGLLNLTDIFTSSVLSVNLDSITGRATRYGLDAPGIETRWERNFPHPSIPSLERTQLLYIGYRIFFRGIMRPGRDIDHPPTFSA
jgi:hypothetical protein